MLVGKLSKLETTMGTVVGTKSIVAQAATIPVLEKFCSVKMGVVFGNL